MILLILVVCCVVTCIFSFYFKRKHYVDLGNKFAGPRAIPLLGNAHFFLNKSPEEIFNKLGQLHQKYGDTYRLWFGPELWVIESNPNQIEEILTSQKLIRKSSDYKFFEPWLGKGLFLSNGTRWAKRRKLLTPAFHFKILDQFLDVFDSQTNTFVEILKEHENEPIDLTTHLQLCTLKIICETAMGVKTNIQLDHDTDYLKAFNKAAEIIYQRIFDALAQNDVYFQMTRNGQILQKVIRTLHDFTDNLIVKRRDEVMKNRGYDNIRNNSVNFDLHDPKKKMALLDILLLSSIDGQPMTNEQIREEVNTFLFAGHDTTTTALTFLLYNLAKHQDVQDKVYGELVKVFGSGDRMKPVTNKLLSNLKYLDIVIKESLRLYPPVPYIGRQILDEITINGVTYPANTNLSIAIALLHQNPKVFPEPERFIPERFEKEIGSEHQNPFCYIPFSGGARNCVGQKFALQEIKVITSKLLWNYRIMLADENEKLVIMAKVVLKSKNGLKVILQPRDK